MRATGIVRRIDDLGRVVIPKEIRRTMRIKEGSPLEIYTDKEGSLILKKYSQVKELNDFASEYAKALGQTLKGICCITDTENIIAAQGQGRKDFLNKPLTAEMEKIMSQRKIVVFNAGDTINIAYEEGYKDGYIKVIAPIVNQGDVLGSVILIFSDKDRSVESARVLSQCAAEFLSAQIEE